MKFTKVMTPSKRTMRIYDIRPGTLFIRKDTVFIKTIPLDIENANERLNAISMSTGKPHFIADTDDIEVFRDSFSITYTNDDLICYTSEPYKS